MRLVGENTAMLYKGSDPFQRGKKTCRGKDFGPTLCDSLRTLFKQACVLFGAASREHCVRQPKALSPNFQWLVDNRFDMVLGW